MPFSQLILLFRQEYRIPDIPKNVSPPPDAEERRERGQVSEDRIHRLENATATLAEISARHDERLAAIERSNQRLEQIVQRLDRTVQGPDRTVQALGELTAHGQRRVTRLEESYVTVAELLRSHRDGVTETRAAQANADAKVAALAESQAHSDRKLDALIDIVRGRFNGQSESS